MEVTALASSANSNNKHNMACSSLLCIFLCLLFLACLPLSAHAQTHVKPSPTNVCPQSVRSAELELSAWSSLTSQSDVKQVYVPHGCAVTQFNAYWRLEVCPGRWIRQIRVDDGVVVEQNILGVQSRWSVPDDVGRAMVQYAKRLSTVPDIIRRSTPAHEMATSATPNAAWQSVPNDYRCYYSTDGIIIVAQYTNGTICESTKRPRKTTVELVCLEGATAPHIQLQEPTLCEYRMVLAASEVCQTIGLKSGEVRQQEKMRLMDIRDEDIRLSL